MKSPTQRKRIYGWKLLILALAASLFGVACTTLYAPSVVSSDDCQGNTQKYEIATNTLPLRVKWKYDTGETIAFYPYASGDLVFIKVYTPACHPPGPDSKAQIIAIDANSGRARWSSAFTGLVTNVNPAISESIAVFPINSERSVRAIDLTSGRVIWEFAVDKDVDRVKALVTDGQNVYVGGDGKALELYAINLNSGRELWRTSTEHFSGKLSSLFLSEANLFILTSNGLIIRNKTAGQQTQQFSSNAYSLEQPIFNGSMVYAVRSDGTHAISLENGKEEWSFSPDCQSSRTWNSPDLIGQTLYITDACSAIFGLNPITGQETWDFSIKGLRGLSHLVMFGGLGYILLSDGSVRAIDLGERKEVGRLTISSPPSQWPVYQQGLADSGTGVYLSFGDRYIYGLGE